MSDIKANINIQDIPDGSDNNQDFYKTFKEKLEAVEKFPKEYAYKFILPKDEANNKLIQDVFEGKDAKFDIKDSKTGKYNAITVLVNVADADEVIKYYQEVSKIKGVMML